MLRFCTPLTLHNCGCPILAFFARVGRDAVDLFREKWTAEPLTPFHSALRGRKSYW